MQLTTQLATTSNYFPTIPGSNIIEYKSQVRKLPRLTIEEEMDLVIQYYEHGNIEAVQKLILHHLRFVVSVAMKYDGYGLPEIDLIQSGNEGLMKSIEKFDHTYGVRFVSYAAQWIKAEIHEYIIRNFRIVKIATTKEQRKLFFNLRKETQHIHNALTNDQAQAVADKLNVSVESVKQMEGRFAAHYNSFDEPADNEDGTILWPSDYLSSDNDNPEKMMIEAEEDKSQLVRELLERLSERERFILQARYIVDEEDKYTLAELSEIYEVSVERIRQIETAAINKIRALVKH